jgi:hypothetical protein
MFTSFKKRICSLFGVPPEFIPVGHQKDCEKHRYDDEGLCYCILEMKHIPMEERHESLRCDDCIHHCWQEKYWKED